MFGGRQRAECAEARGDRRLSPRNFIRGKPGRAPDRSAVPLRVEGRVGELPDALAAGRYLKHVTRVAFRDERVAVRQTLSAATRLTEESWVGILPDHLSSEWVDLQDSRLLEAVIEN